MSYALYQDPLQSQPIEMPQTGIGGKLVPERFSINDPVLLRHLFCAMNGVRNLFHIYLCWRQLRYSDSKKLPPPELANVMTQEVFESTKAEHMFAVENTMHAYGFDLILSCLELYFCVFPYIWTLVIETYRIADDLIWQSIAFMALFTVYMTVRQLPQIIYSKFFLEPFYAVVPEKSLPLVGLLCYFTVQIVLLQVVLVPTTIIFTLMEKQHILIFLLSIWGLIFVMSVVAIILCCIFGLPFLGKRIKLQSDKLEKALKPVLEKFNFSTSHIYVIQTFQTLPARAYAWKCICFRRLFILDNLIYNQGKPASELDANEVGKGLHINQLVAYIAHELIHSHLLHFYKSLGLIHVTLGIYLTLFGMLYVNSSVYEAAGFSAVNYPTIVGYWLVFKYVMPLYLTVTNWIIFYFLRFFEFEADRHIFRMGYGIIYIEALAKLFSDSPAYPFVDKWYMMWNRYRPTALSRISRLKLMYSSS